MSPVSSTPASPAGRPPPMSAAQAFQQLDSAGKGYLTVDDLKQAGPPPERDSVRISAEAAAAAGSATRPDAEAAFAKMDSDGNGQVTASEFTAAAPARRPGGDGDGDQDGGPTQAAPAGRGGSGGAAAARAARGGAGGAGGGAGDGEGGRAAASTGASRSATTTYEPADANRDGKVSQPEQQAYDQKQAQTQPAAPHTPNAQTTEALKAYADVAASA